LTADPQRGTNGVLSKAPEDPKSGLSRRSLFARTGAAALGATTLAGLAGCENTTTPVAASGAASGGPGLLGDPTAGGPVDSAGIPLARRDYPVTLPRFSEPVSASEKPETGGVFKIYSYADYLNPDVLKEFGKQEGVEVKVTTFDSVDEAFSKLSTAGLEFDVIVSTPDQLSKLVGRKLLQPLNEELVPNLEKNIWEEIHSPFYDVGSRYTVPYVVYTTGIGWRNDKVNVDPASLENGWDALWDATSQRGKTQLLDDKREALGMAMLREGQPDLNTASPEIVNIALAALDELAQNVKPKVQISAYETLPAGRITIGQMWSGDLLSGTINYLPKGTPASALSYWYQAEGGPVFNDILTVAAASKKPIIAHRFLNYMMEPQVAYDNFVNYVGYQPPQKSLNAAKLFDEGILPKSLSNAVVTQEAYAAGNGYLTLTAEGEQAWEKAWSKFRAG
jgi:spermidine/putrescine transport system substrate-binding protein